MSGASQIFFMSLGRFCQSLLRLFFASWGALGACCIVAAIMGDEPWQNLLCGAVFISLSGALLYDTFV